MVFTQMEEDFESEKYHIKRRGDFPVGNLYISAESLNRWINEREYLVVRIAVLLNGFSFTFPSNKI